LKQSRSLKQLYSGFRNDDEWLAPWGRRQCTLGWGFEEFGGPADAGSDAHVDGAVPKAGESKVFDNLVGKFGVIGVKETAWIILLACPVSYVP
jgi:hypothetical protein